MVRKRQSNRPDKDVKGIQWPITRWVREGRNPGFSITLTTPIPAIPADTLSQADILVIHRLTLLDDVKAVGNLASIYAWP